jgi:hypothetical protein
MDNKQKQEQVSLNRPVNSTEIFKHSLSNTKPRFYDTDSLHELLCSRYGLSRHTNKEKLIDLVVEELNI